MKNLIKNPLLEELINNLSNCIIFCDVQGNFILWNTAAKNIVGVQPEISSTGTWQKYYNAFKMDGSPYTDNTYPLMRSVLTGEVIRKERMLINNQANNNHSYLEIDSFPVRDLDNNIIAAVSSFTDVTNNVKMEKMIDEFEIKIGHMRELISNSMKELL